MDRIGAAGTTRKLEMSRTGRWLLVTHGGERKLVDLAGTMPRRVVEIDMSAIVTFVGRELWAVSGNELMRITPTNLRLVSPAMRLPGVVRDIVASGGATVAEGVLVGQPTMRAGLRTDSVVLEVLDEAKGDERVVAAIGGRVYVAGSEGMRAFERGRERWHMPKTDGEVLAAVNLFAGRAIAVLLRRAENDAIAVIQAHGGRIHVFEFPRVIDWAVAEELGQAFVYSSDGKVRRLDLRYGREIASGTPIAPFIEIQVDEHGRQMVLLTDTDEVLHIQAAELLQASSTPPAESEETDTEGDDDGVNGHAVEPVTVTVTEIADARAIPLPADHRPPPARVEIPDLLPLALGPAPLPLANKTGDGSPYEHAREHLDALLDIIAARAALSIADGWNSGRLSPHNVTPRPHELEVEALLGVSGSFAPDKLVVAQARLEKATRDAAERAEASVAAGARLPFPTLIREIGASPVAAMCLLVVAAPALRGEIARLYGVLTDDPARPMVDRFLVEQVMSGTRGTMRDHIARELGPDSALIRHGLVQVDPAPTAVFARLSCPDALLDRLRGLSLPRHDDLTQMRGADVSLTDLLIPAAVKRAAVLALAEPTPSHAPIRLVLRGRRGSGRHSLVAAFAAKLEREIIAIDTTRLPHTRRELVTGLRTALFRASLHGVVPVLSGLELIDPTDVDVRDAVRHVLRTHPGPLCIRTSPEGTLPLDPGFISLTIPMLSETERAASWRHLLERANMHADHDRLASRYRIGPGIVRKVITGLATASPGRGDATAALDEQVRQHVAARLDHVAKRVDRLAHWEDIALPNELLDSLREFISRAHHRRTVYEHWGYDAKMTTSRGLTALFYGPPGTGKTMVAGVIAQELGLDMFRVDLARVVSKWVGETEKNLAEVFDAAEDGQVLILFDEADSLFAKRTDVKTSNDRYANLEVNYLLQRLDTFEGVAILTSNLDGAIDPAFKRRLSLRLQFPFPDEDTRVRLWASHVTPETPIAGDFDFVDLARRFPLSGGYIRNCALRAAFLAAHEATPMGQEHLVRAIQLEYREMGKLSTTSRLE
jgi:hypothetical protein